MRFSTFAAAAALFDLSIAGYVLQDDYMTDFFGGFDFFTEADPTEGFVNYVDEATAKSTNLINSSSTTAVQWGVDTQNKTPNGRPSVRITSKKSYDSGLIVLDVAHMPFGCGTWPAFWTVGPNWPKNGEIDILEGVNEQTNNGMTLHTGPGCQVGSDTTQFSGTVNSDNCDVAAFDQAKNTGCSIEHPSTKSYGAGLNAIGGGVYATQWTDEAISVYYFPRGSIPEDVLGANPDPTSWGKPAAKFTGGCDIAETFKKQQLVFDTTFCGQWAGAQNVWDASSCSKKASTCEEWVRDNPEAFAEAYWEINALKVYQDNGEAAPAPAPVSSSTPVKSTAVSKPVPVSTVKSRSSTGVPKVSTRRPVSTKAPITSAYAVKPTASAVVPPIAASSIAVDLPVSSTKVAAVPLPTSAAAPTISSGAPQASKTQVVASSAKTTKTAANQPAAPTGTNGMPGFQWPLGGGDDTPASSTTAAASSRFPASTGTIATPPAAQNIVSPSNAPAVEVPAPAPTASSAAAPIESVVSTTVQAAYTVYETVYVTATADPVATPAPAAQKARMARHIREHRQRLTRHNIRL